MQLYIMDIRELERIDRPEELLRSDKRKSSEIQVQGGQISFHRRRYSDGNEGA